MLKCENLIVGNEPNTILNNISFNALPGEITAIIGPSGSGKTTVLRCLSRLISPTSGNLTFNSLLLSKVDPSDIGMVFQSFNLFPHLTVLQNLTIAPLTKGWPKEETNQKAHQLLDQFGLKSKANVYPCSLSGGQKQRVAIARALMKDPHLLLFDEPTSALDPEMVQEVGEVIESLKRPDRVIVMVTHEMRLAKNVSDHVIFIDHGHILDDVNCDQFFSGDENAKISSRAKRFISNLMI